MPATFTFFSTLALAAVRTLTLTLALTLALALKLTLHAQSFASEPIQGHTTTSSITVWLMTQDTDSLTVWLEGQEDARQTRTTTAQPAWKRHHPHEFTFTGLQPGTPYRLNCALDRQPPQAFDIRTLGADTPPAYSFGIGSCAMYGLGAMRLIRPGSFTHIYDAMRATPSDFFLWLGDNVYLLLGEWDDTTRTYEKHTKVRLEPRLNAFMRSRPQYAILDDHDFGPDNSGAEFEGKGMTEAAFADFWPNPYAGTPETPGNFCHYTWHDSEFFLLDGRYYRQAADSSQMYGPGQMAWLKEKLQQSTATFKFIATGSQSLSPVNPGEVWQDYQEQQEFLQWLQEQRIEGVIFLSGDRHFTEMMRLEIPGMYPLHEVTCSPLTSILRRKPLQADDVEHVNPIRIPGTLLVDHNFGRIFIEGPTHDRTCRIQVLDAEGNPVWQQSIPASQLKF